MNDPNRWLPGQSGNLTGRPRGARTEFSTSFMRDLARVWAKRGGDIIEKVAANDPSRFFAVAASLIPRDVAISIEQRLPGGLSPDDWSIAMGVFQAVKEALPDANSRAPGEVLNFVLDAIKAHRAPLIEDSRDSDCLLLHFLIEP